MVMNLTDISLHSANKYWLVKGQEALDEEKQRESNDKNKERMELLRKKLPQLLVADQEVISQEIEAERQWINSNNSQQKANEEIVLPFAWLDFLLQLQRYLIARDNDYTMETAHLDELERSIAQEKKPTIALAEYLKKIVIFIRNKLRIFQAASILNLTPLVAVLLTGSFGFILHFWEGAQSLVEALRAYQNQNIPQKRTRIVTHGLTALFAGTGVGLSLTLLASLLGAVVSGTALIVSPFIISGFFAAIYGLALWRNIYILSQVKEQEIKAQHDFAKTSLLKYTCLAELHKLETQIKQLQTKLLNPGQQQPLNEQDDAVKQEYKGLMQAMTIQQRELSKLSIQFMVAEKQLTLAQEKKFQAERTLFFNIIDTTASILTLVATILITAAILGGSIASFGAVPLGLLIAGVVIGVINQLFKHYDSNKECSYTRLLRNKLTQLHQESVTLSTKPSPDCKLIEESMPLISKELSQYTENPQKPSLHLLQQPLIQAENSPNNSDSSPSISSEELATADPQSQLKTIQNKSL